jgi:hypothetical protein
MVGIAAQELEHHWLEDHLSRAQGAVDAQRAGWRRLALADGCHRIVYVRDRRPYLIHESTACFRQADAAGGAVKQSNAQPRF